ncbi:MAG: OsmC family protein [Chloroflexi bacterium]|jgi:putative redox protein|nr:OsmC family protein [Chloroflexota bacterium]
MESKVVWNGGLTFTGSSDSGIQIPLDTIPALGGSEESLRPLQLFAIGLVGCTGMDVISILQKKRQEVTAFEVSAQIQRAEDHPKVFTKILLEYKVTGKNLDLKAIERAVELSETRYCPAQAMLEKTAEISSKITLIAAED